MKPDLFDKTPSRPRLDLDGVILERRGAPGTHWTVVDLPPAWRAAGWTLTRWGSLTCKIGAVSAGVAIKHGSRPNGLWYGSASRHVSPPPAGSRRGGATFGIPCEDAEGPQGARDVALRLAAELNEAIREAAADLGPAWYASDPDNPWEVWYVATARTDGAPPDPTKAQYSHIYYSLEDARVIAKDEPRLVVVRAVMTGRRVEVRA